MRWDFFMLFFANVFVNIFFQFVGIKKLLNVYLADDSIQMNQLEFLIKHLNYQN